MEFLPESIQDLIQEFAKLPGIGPKTAQRLTFYLLRSHRSLHESLGEALLKLKDRIAMCEWCCNLANESPCKICRDISRDHSMICVVEEMVDAMAIEKTHEYKGLYHVLHGAISPIDGIGPEDLTLKALEERMKKNNCKNQEIIIATNPNTEGDTTAIYIQKLLKPYSVKVTRIACGIPIGGDLEYADQLTLKNALMGRRIF